jgi:NAD(P)-dependent dehydrogenase (short-subunit alcohol dehydrogenase family)
MRLEGRVAIITGGAGGIGLATARRFLDEGCAGVHLVDLRTEALESAAAELSDDARVGWTAGDVSRSEDVARYTRDAEERFGRVDILFLNAGVEGVVLSMTEYPEEVYDQVMGVNAKGIWLGMKHGFPALERAGGGSVIITSSVAGLMGTPNVSAYTTSKHAAIGLMRSGALEGAPAGIRVNSMHPSPVDNRMMRSLEEGFAPGEAEGARKGFETQIPLGRYGTNEEIADLALFLASDESRFITGAIIPIDGGMTV